MDGTYSQYIRDTRRAWAKQPKSSLLNEIITTQEAIGFIRSEASGRATINANLADLYNDHIVYLGDDTCLRCVGGNEVRHWR